jgi:FeS assembly SUF system regulator
VGGLQQLAWLRRVGRNLTRQKRTDTVPYYDETDAVLTINKLSDYAIVVAACLAASAGGQATARTLAQATRIPLPTVVKLLKILTAGGVLESIQGRNGGYRLARPPTGISLAQIIEAVEGPITLTECTRDASGCRVEAICGVRGHWLVINTAIRQTLAAISLADLAKSLPGPDAWRPRASAPSFYVDLQGEADVPATRD